MMEKSPADPLSSPRSRLGMTAELLVWIWTMAGLCYFYYSQGYLELCKHLWTQAIG